MIGGTSRFPAHASASFAPLIQPPGSPAYAVRPGVQRLATSEA